MKSLLAVAVLVSAAAAVAAPDDSAKPFTVSVAEIDAKAKVVKVDPSAKTVTIKGPDGKKVKIEVPTDVYDLSKVQEGSWADVHYLQAVAFAAAKPGQPLAVEEETAHLEPKGGTPSEVVVNTKHMSAMVKDIDTAQHEITVRDVDGATQTLKLAPDFQDVDKIKIGDTLMLQFTSAVALQLGESK